MCGIKLQKIKKPFGVSDLGYGIFKVKKETENPTNYHNNKKISFSSGYCARHCNNGKRDRKSNKRDKGKAPAGTDSDDSEISKPKNDDDKLCAEVYPNFQYIKSKNIEKDKIKNKIWEIIELKNKELPPYEKIVRLTMREIPFEKTASNKIMRNKFKEILIARKKNNEKTKKENILPPENEMKKSLYDIISIALSISEPYSLDSVNVTILTNKLREKYSIPLHLRDIIENTSVLKIENIILELQKDNENNNYKIDMTVYETYPITVGEAFFMHLMRGISSSNIAGLFKLDKGIDLKFLKNSFVKLLDINIELKSKIYKDENGEVKLHRNDNANVNIAFEKITDKEWEIKKKN
ncbi:hypothetical protein PIROE2DRAFT_14241 [Piromyces sp. E2]|nr:hypothetical protein PIROE2DRAFT_14241 [Piromyces sp. E2]|eukprot:OUM60081.1 hypothetical protein PIROE2DRAFT_14241 [Piromyces sp. E2]